MYTHALYKYPQRVRIYFPGGYKVFYKPPYVVLGNCTFPTEVQYYRDVLLRGINQCGNDPCLGLTMMHAWILLDLAEHLVF